MQLCSRFSSTRACILFSCSAICAFDVWMELVVFPYCWLPFSTASVLASSQLQTVLVMLSRVRAFSHAGACRCIIPISFGDVCMIVRQRIHICVDVGMFMGQSTGQCTQFPRELFQALAVLVRTWRAVLKPWVWSSKFPLLFRNRWLPFHTERQGAEGVRA